MKRIIAFLLSVATLLCLCGCGSKTFTMEGQSDRQTPLASKKTEDFSKINELEPNKNGVYQIHSVKGLQNIANHPDGSFELLCDIDLAGAEWMPIGSQTAPFTGKLNGKSFTISNFVIRTQPQGDAGFIAVNEGAVENLNLAGVQLDTTADTVRAGSIAGSNRGKIQNCTATGTLKAEFAASEAYIGGAVGYNTGSLLSTVVTVDMSVSVANALVGGLVGLAQGGKVEASQTCGRQDMAGEGLTVGLLAGKAENVNFQSCVFLGAASLLNGQEYRNYIGDAQSANAVECLRRDNSRQELDPQLRALRDKVVKRMYDMGSVLWTVSEPIIAKCTSWCDQGGCRTSYVPGNVYRGFPYRHNTGSLERFMYCMDENLVAKDWVYDLSQSGGHSAYMGSDCLRSAQMAWLTVGNSVNIPFCMAFVKFPNETGAQIVGDLPAWTEADVEMSTTQYAQRVGIDAIYEAYTQMWAGDVFVHITEGGSGHAIMAATDPVVVRDDEGNIDPYHSYFLTHEQGRNENTDEFFSSWSINRKNTFYMLVHEYTNVFIPYTMKELQEGETDIPEATITGGMEGVLGLMTGVVSSNFYMDSVTVKVTDSQGATVFEKTMFTRVDDIKDFRSQSQLERLMVSEFNLASFTYPLAQVQFLADETYHATITADLLTGDHIVVKDFEF